MGQCSLSAWPGCRRRSRRSHANPRRVWAPQPCLRRGQVFTAAMIRSGRVIHQLGRSAFEGALPSLVNNSGRHIRAPGLQRTPIPDGLL